MSICAVSMIFKQLCEDWGTWKKASDIQEGHEQKIPTEDPPETPEKLLTSKQRVSKCDIVCEGNSGVLSVCEIGTGHIASRSTDNTVRIWNLDGVFRRRVVTM